MKFSKVSQLFLVSMIGLLVATLFSACQLVTIDYVYLAGDFTTASSSNGRNHGACSRLPVRRLRFAAGTDINKPIDSGGPSPVAIATSGDYSNLYVANQGNNSVVHFSIATNGTLTKKDSVTLADPPPTSP